MQPEQIGPWKIDRRIGAGGMGSVYLASHQQTGEVAAVKVLSEANSGNEASRERFTREIEALRQLSSPWIVQLLDSGISAAGVPFFAMEFVDGKPLSELILERKRLPWQQAVTYSIHLATALKAAHDSGIIHRDLKPGNMMVTPDGLLKLADFGVASLFAASPLTRPGGVLGTVDYMSPEQAAGRCNARSDLYSMGAVMYAMLTGRPPFSGRTTADIMHKHQFASFDKPSRFVPEIPIRLEELVCELLSKKPADRPANALTVIRILERIRRLDEATTSDAEGSGKLADATLNITGHDHAAVEQDVIDRTAAVAVRDLMRAELEKNQRRGGLLDNTYVLIALLILIVIFAVQMGRRGSNSAVRPEITTATLPEALQRISADPPTPDRSWLRLRDHVLLPALERSSPNSEQSAQIMAAVRRVNDFEFLQSLTAMTPQQDQSTEHSVHEEYQRLIRAALRMREIGDTKAALEQLQRVRSLVGRQADARILADYLESTIEVWESDHQRGAVMVLEQLVRQAEQQQQAGELSPEMLDALHAARKIYTDRAGLLELLDRIRSLLKPAD
jgi:serine/threonine-protein kinase